MKKHFYPVMVLLAVFVYLPASGQFLNKLQKKLKGNKEEPAQQEEKKEDDKGINKALKSIFGVPEDSESEDGTEADSTAPGQPNMGFGFGMGSGEPVPVEDRYIFDTRVVYQMTADNHDSKKEDVTMDMISWFEEGADYSATRIKTSQDQQPLNVLTIIDTKNEAMIVILEDQKMAQVMSTKNMKEEGSGSGQGEPSTPGDKPTIRKTGRTKKILGYTCYEYEIKDKDTEGTFWIAPEAKVYSGGMFKGNIFGNDSPSIAIPEDQQGMLMEMNTVVTDEDGKKSNIKLIVKSIDRKSMTVNMDDYQKMNIGLK